MPALNFRGEFVDSILDGSKTQTVRLPRKRPIDVADDLYLYTGMRTPACRPLGVAKCSMAYETQISATGVRAFPDPSEPSTRSSCERFAQLDGFDSYASFWDTWTTVHGDAPASVVVIQWRAFRPVVEFNTAGLRQLIRESGLSAREIGRRSGVAFSSISRFLNSDIDDLRLSSASKILCALRALRAS